MRIEQRDYSFVFPSGVTNVNLTTDFSSLSKCFANITGEERVRHQRAIDSRDDRVQRDDARRNQISSRFDQTTRRRIDLSDDVFDAGKRAEPVRRVRQLRPRDARKEILRATRKARNLVW